MATSLSSSFNLDFVEAIEEAHERCGLELRGGFEMRSARRSINIMFADWANRGLNMWTIEERSLVLTEGTSEYTLGEDIVDLIEYMVQIPNTSQETRYNLSRVSVSTYAGRTNPTIIGRPTEIYVNRTQPAPIVHLWPVPGPGGPYTLKYWVLRRIQDAGAYTNTADLPFRFLPAFIAGLAYYIAEKKRTDDPGLIARLEQSYAKAWTLAADEDRDRSTLTLVPRGSAYRVGRV